MHPISTKERCLILAEDLVANKSTVRAVAAKYGISKSTVHKDITQHLVHIDISLHSEVQKVLETNKKERHIRGGEATRKKYITSAKITSKEE